MRDVINRRELFRRRRPRLSGDKIDLRVTLPKDEFFQLRELKERMKCRNWYEFFKKILEKKEILESDIVAF